MKLKLSALRNVSVKKVSVKVVLIAAIVIFGSIAFITALIVMAHINSLRASGAEYDDLRDLASSIIGSGETPAELSALDLEMLEINPDYVCWIRVDGTGIDHPVVRGEDNEQYLTMSFSGEYNIAGTLFMDYRIGGELATYTAGESLPHIIIYGHNTLEGGMFSNLRRFRSEQFYDENRFITLIVNDREVIFEIFSARQTTINDPAYFLNFSAPRSFYGFADRINAPIRATQIITLSTCVSAGDNDERFIVQGYRLMD